MLQEVITVLGFKNPLRRWGKTENSFDAFQNWRPDQFNENCWTEVWRVLTAVFDKIFNPDLNQQGNIMSHFLADLV